MNLYSAPRVRKNSAAQVRRALISAFANNLRIRNKTGDWPAAVIEKRKWRTRKDDGCLAQAAAVKLGVKGWPGVSSYQLMLRMGILYSLGLEDLFAKMLDQYDHQSPRASGMRVMGRIEIFTRALRKAEEAERKREGR